MIDVKFFRTLDRRYWRWPHFYRPTCLYKHAFGIGPLVIFWRRRL